MIGKQITKGGFLFNVLTLMTGTGLSQAIPIVFSPLLTRIYSPADFGRLAFFMASCAIVGIVATGRYELAIMLPKEDEESINILVMIVLLSLGVSFIVLLVIILFGYPLLQLLNYPVSFDFFLLLPIGVFFTGCFQGLNFWLNRKGEYNVISRCRISQSLTTALLSVLIGYFDFIKYGLIVSFLIGLVVPVIPLVFIISKNIKAISKTHLITAIKKYLNYPKYLMPTAFFDTTAMQAPVFFITKYFTKVVAGSYSLAFRMVTAPLGVISGAMGQVYYQKITSIVNSQNPKTYPTVIKTAKSLGLVSVVIFLPLFFFGENIFKIVFGINWTDAGKYVEILSVAMMLRFIVSPLSTIFIAVSSIRVGAAWQTLYLCTTIALFFVGRDLSIQQLLWAYVVHELVLYSIYFILMVYVSNKFDKKFLCVE